MILPPMRTRNPIVDVALVAAGVLLAKPLSKLVKKLTRKEKASIPLMETSIPSAKETPIQPVRETPIQPMRVEVFNYKKFMQRLNDMRARHQKSADSPPDETE